MFDCKNCGARIREDKKYGDMSKCKFLLCAFRPKQKIIPGKRPKWCPRKVGN